MTVIEVTTDSFERDVLRHSEGRPVVVDFWAAWCQPCLVLGPVLEELAEEDPARFVLAKVDVDANPELAEAYGVQGIPAVKAFRDGTVVDEFVGALPPGAVREWLRGVAPGRADRLVEEAAGAAGEGRSADAEAALRRALEVEPSHEAASLALAGVLAGREDGRTEAAELLSRLPPSDEARRLLSSLQLAGWARTPEERAALEDAGDAGARIELARARAAGGEHETALAELIALVREAPDARGEARDAMVAIFDLLGPEHPLTVRFRRELATALF